MAAVALCGGRWSLVVVRCEDVIGVSTMLRGAKIDSIDPKEAAACGLSVLQSFAGCSRGTKPRRILRRGPSAFRFFLFALVASFAQLFLLSSVS